MNLGDSLSTQGVKTHIFSIEKHTEGKIAIQIVYNRVHNMLQYLVNSYNTDPYVKWLLDNTRIHILPSMNPDGFEVAREGQCDGGQGR